MTPTRADSIFRRPRPEAPCAGGERRGKRCADAGRAVWQRRGSPDAGARAEDLRLSSVRPSGSGGDPTGRSGRGQSSAPPRRRRLRATPRGADAHNLPDAVLALHGIVDIEVATRIDSTHGRLRAIVGNVPDAPVSRFVLAMQGGRKGLIVNSTDLCAAKHRARVNAKGQNGRSDLIRPVVRATRCKAEHRRRSTRHRRGGGRKGHQPPHSSSPTER
jgi:hypothetical protein